MNSENEGEILLIPTLSDACVKVNNLVNLNHLDIAVIGKNDVKQLQTYYQTEINGTVVLRNHSAINNLYVYPVNDDVVILDIDIENGQTIEELFDVTDEDLNESENFTLMSVDDTELAELNDMDIMSFRKHFRLNHFQIDIAKVVQTRQKRQVLAKQEDVMLYVNLSQERYDEDVN